MSQLIYLGEDSPVESRLMRGLLEPEWQVETFENGLDLYRKVHRQPPALVITDLMLPQLDGFLLVRLLKFDSQFESLPILCVSSILEQELEKRLKALGSDGYLPKPLDPERFTETVSQLLTVPTLV